MGLFDGLFGNGRAFARAKQAELRGDLALAVTLYLEGRRVDDAARVLVLRGDAETNPSGRLIYYTQAAQTAALGGEQATIARRKRAELRVALAGDSAHSAVAKRDLYEAAAELEALGDELRAAEVYAVLGDSEGQARALTVAGEIDKLEALLAATSAQEKRARENQTAAAEVAALHSQGERRKALELARKLSDSHRGDSKLMELLAHLRSRRVNGPVVNLHIGPAASARRVTVVLGDEITIGRSDGTLNVIQSAVSRKHLSIKRGKDGAEVSDLSTRNGTLLRGMRLAGSIPVKDGIELRLGGEVRVYIAPSSSTPGAYEIELAGERYLAPLGALILPEATASLTMAFDGWVEVTGLVGSLYQSELAMVPRIQALKGDQFGGERTAEPTLHFLD